MLKDGIRLIKIFIQELINYANDEKKNKDCNWTNEPPKLLDKIYAYMDPTATKLVKTKPNGKRETRMAIFANGFAKESTNKTF